ncbi:hypothetical protein BRC80_04270 [Halobacteriales archaeon QH_9_66_26]|nr:MAG: hypothetical protein BRC80_04270 [Halobacteriales archaeon QH_9_66_26]
MSLTRFRLKEASIWLVGLGLLAGAVVLSYRMGTAEFVDEFAALSLRNKALVGGGVVLGIVLIGEIWTRSTVDFSAVIALAAGTFWVVEEMQEGETQRAQSGREKYYSGVGDSVRRGLTHAGGGALEIDRVDKRKQAASVHPTIDRQVSAVFLGQTNMGKSIQVRKLLGQWDLDEPVIAHAISEPGGYNELRDELDVLDADTVTISSRDSDVRWGPFLDRSESVREMTNISQGVFDTNQSATTGWSDAARTMLTAAITVTNAKHGDFAALPDILDQGPDEIIAELAKVPNTGTLHTSLDTLDDTGRSSAFNTMTNRFQSLLESDVFNADLDRVSFEECFAADGRAIVLDNVRAGSYARGFWRFFLESAIDQAFSTKGRQQFVIDSCDGAEAVANALVADGFRKEPFTCESPHSALCVRAGPWRWVGSGGGYAVGLWPALRRDSSAVLSRSPFSTAREERACWSVWHVAR